MRACGCVVNGKKISKDQCKTHSPGLFCPLPCGKAKESCVEHNGSRICFHGKRKDLCINCNGSALCEHKVQRQSCKDCKGVNYCECQMLKRYCKIHGGSKLCINCHDVAGHERYQSNCLECFKTLYPDDLIVERIKAKEDAVILAIRQRFPDLQVIQDKRIPQGKSSRRPDALIDLEPNILLVEVDEYKHETYGDCYEEQRFKEIVDDVYPRKLAMIRFNPDAYVNENGVTVPSCWARNEKTRKLEVKKKSLNDWQNRIDKLCEEIEFYVNNDMVESTNVKYLFYDHEQIDGDNTNKEESIACDVIDDTIDHWQSAGRWR